jgi:hypothetical protein
VKISDLGGWVRRVAGGGAQPEDAAVRGPGRGWWVLLGVVVLAALGLYLVRLHYAKVYSDPVGFVGMALNWGSGQPVTDRAPIYPMILSFFLKALGRDWVFLSNLPFVLLMVFLTGVAGYVAVRRPGVAGTFFAGLTGLVAVVILVRVRGSQLLELVNPFREPIAFSLALLAVILMVGGWGRRSAPWWMAGSGLCLGLAASTRETLVLLAVPLGTWFLVRMVAERKLHVLRAVLFMAGLLAGLAPMLLQNRAHSGRALVPSYAAEKTEALAQWKKWDIPIPGMSLHYFGTVGPSTVRKLYQQYTPIGALLLLLGLVRAVRRRNDVILGLYVPAALLNLLFYCFYRYFKARYTLAAELFAIPVMAYGAAGIAEALEAALRCWRPRFVSGWRMAVSAGVAVGLLATVLPPALRGDDRTKVWHLAKIREQIRPHLTFPASFMGQRHVAFYLAWLLDQSSYEYALEFWRSLPDPAMTTPIEDRLKEQGALTLERFARGNYYVDDPVFALGRNWLELTPVFSFDSLTVPLERYGRRLTGNLYRVGLWKKDRQTLTVDRGAAGPAVLMLDMKRIWDYPGRTYAQLRFGAEGPILPLSNAVQFLDLPAAGRGRTEVHLKSNRPLPPSPYCKILKPDDPVRVQFGLAGDHWAWNLASSNQYPNRSIPSDSCLLYDESVLRLPNYASPDRDAYAVLRVEFIQEHPFWRRKTHTLSAETASDRTSIRLPGERTTAILTIGLGRGEGRLKMVPVTLKTTLPSYTAQNTAPLYRECSRNGFVKIYEVRVVSVPPVSGLPVRIDLGGAEDSLHVGDGFYGTEQSGKFTARWTAGRGSIRVRLPKPDGAIVARWYALPVRKDQTNLTARFFVNETAIPADRVSVVAGSPLWEYRVKIEPGELITGDWNRLVVEVPTWSPARDLGVADPRELGLLLDRVEIGPD